MTPAARTELLNGSVVLALSEMVCEIRHGVTSRHMLPENSFDCVCVCVCRVWFWNQADGTEVGPEALDGKVLALYFSASWCAPCKQFTPILKKVYNKLVEAGEKRKTRSASASEKRKTEIRSHACRCRARVDVGASRRDNLPQRLLGSPRTEGCPVPVLWVYHFCRRLRKYASQICKN